MRMRICVRSAPGGWGFLYLHFISTAERACGQGSSYFWTIATLTKEGRTWIEELVWKGFVDLVLSHYGRNNDVTVPEPAQNAGMGIEITCWQGFSTKAYTHGVQAQQRLRAIVFVFGRGRC
jgi:hypothetical protein